MSPDFTFFDGLVYLRVGEVNITFNVNPSCRTAASEIQFF